MERSLCRASAITSKDLDLDERYGIQGCLLENPGILCSENLARLPNQAAFLQPVSNSLVFTAHALRTLMFFLSPTPATLLSTSLSLRKCSAVGGPFILGLHCSICVCHGQESRYKQLLAWHPCCAPGNLLRDSQASTRMEAENKPEYPCLFVFL